MTAFAQRSFIERCVTNHKTFKAAFCSNPGDSHFVFELRTDALSGESAVWGLLF